MDGVHDMGGLHGFGPVVVEGSDEIFHEDWEVRVFALSQLISVRGLVGGPGGRAVRESMDAAHYLEASYYERWLWSAERRLEAKGSIAPGEVESMIARLEANESPPTATNPGLAAQAVAELRQGPPGMGTAVSPRFAPGDRVRVRRIHPAGHTRCPRYVRGAVGVVERVQGTDLLPDRATYGLPTEPEPVYAVAFTSQELWGDSEEPPWTVLLDLFDTYLEPA
ncbi:MAG TPA: nitrile hydratase subunit beta [Propionibacteriaceae bacterium]